MSRLIAIFILTLLCTMNFSYADYPGTVWRSQLAVPSSEPENVKSNILSPDESKIYVLTEHELYVYNTENGDLLHMYIDELDYATDSSEATFTGADLSADGEKLFVLGDVNITEDGIENSHTRFFVFDLKAEMIVHDELLDVYKDSFTDIIFSAALEKLFLSSHNYLISINANDFADKSSITTDRIDKLYLSPNEKFIATTSCSSYQSNYNIVNYIILNFYDPINLKTIYSTKAGNSSGGKTYKNGSFTPDNKYFCMPSNASIVFYELNNNFKFIGYDTGFELGGGKFQLSRFNYSQKHLYKGIVNMNYTGGPTMTTMVSFSEYEPFEGTYIKNTGSDFVQMTEAEDFYYEISQDTLSKHILDWAYTTNVSLPETIRTSEVYPNPVDDLLIVDFELNQTNATVVELVNAAGISVRRIDAGLLSAGEHHIGVNVADLPAGVYFTRVRSGRSLITNKFVKVE